MGEEKKVPEGQTSITDEKIKVEKPVVNVFSLKKDMDDFKKETKATNDKILGVLESLVNKDENVSPEPLAEEPKETESEIAKLTKQQRDIFEYYFDPVDGFKAWYDINLNIFTIDVPMKLSNNTDAHKVLYKQDLRSKKVDQNNILGSMKAWCILVAQNLKYERRIKLK